MSIFTVRGFSMIGQGLTDYIHYLRFEKRYSSHTITGYNTDLLQFSQYLQDTFSIADARSVSHFHIRSWLATLKEAGQKPRSINRKISSVQSFFRFLLRHGQVDKNPAGALMALRTPERLPVYMKEKETELLFQEVQFPEGFKGLTERLICELLYQTGMRRSELAQLKEQDIEWSLAQIRILGKGNKERLVPLSPQMLQTLKYYLSEKKKNIEPHDHPYFLVLDSGLPLYPHYIYRTIQKYLSIATTLPKKSPHVMRHTFATHLLANGANIQAIKDLLGHSSLAATQVYTHNNVEKLKEIHKLSHPRS